MLRDGPAAGATRRQGPLTLLSALAASLALALATVPVSPSAASSARSAAVAHELLITGAGAGHGVGMSQYGAYGLAQHGYSYQQILAHYYTGTAVGQAPAGAIVRVLVGSRVKKVPLEQYVRGVVSAEMPAQWPLAALEAQAVASRTYALTAHAGGSRFDVYADTRSQVYKGAAAETASTNAAVSATAGQIVTYQGQPAITYFYASSGGVTESVQDGFPGSAPEPWLVGVADPYDQGPLHSWKVALSFATVAARLHRLLRGSFRGIEVLTRGVSPRILQASILGSGGHTNVGGAELAARLGLYDSWAYFSVRNGSAVTPEPDRSGYVPPPASTSAPPAPATAPQGGTSTGPSTPASPAGGGTLGGASASETSATTSAARLAGGVSVPG
jgi:SpoIID/LytB domain protein